MGDLDIFHNSTVGCRRKLLSQQELNGTGNDNIVFCQDMILDWQKRELDTITDAKPQLGLELTEKMALKRAKEINQYVMDMISYESDMEVYDEIDYWATSDEVMIRGRDDCDGQSVIQWRMLRNLGLPDDMIGMTIVNGHMFACLHLTDDDFYMMDNGRITKWVEKGSDVFPFYDRVKDRELIPLVGFNLFNIWMYY